MDETKVDLNAPAFGEGSQKVTDLLPAGNVTEPAPQVKKEPEPTEEQEPVVVKEPVVEPEDLSDEKSKVPYNRFKKYHDLAADKEKEAEYWRGVAEVLKNQPVPEKTQDEPPAYWVEMYGESDASRRAWEIQSEQNERIKKEAAEGAILALQETQKRESTLAKENEDLLDGHLEEVSAVAGRDLTDKEQEALLDIIDDYTPKNADGNYAGALINPDKAWEIYNLKQNALKAPQRQSRDAAAALIASQSQGQPDADKQERDKNWNPLDWNGWKKRLP